MHHTMERLARVLRPAQLFGMRPAADTDLPRLTEFRARIIAGTDTAWSMNVGFTAGSARRSPLSRKLPGEGFGRSPRFTMEREQKGT